MMMRLAYYSAFFLRKLFVLEENHDMEGRRPNKGSLFYCSTV
jgi:hypothetical protein